jgi:hypothetical protein
MAITWLTIVDAINSVMDESIDEAQVDVELVYSYMDRELKLHFFKTSNYSSIVTAMTGENKLDSALSSSIKSALKERFKIQRDGTFFSSNEPESLVIKSYLEDFGCVVDYKKVAR